MQWYKLAVLSRYDLQEGKHPLYTDSELTWLLLHAFFILFFLKLNAISFSGPESYVSPQL